MSIWIQAAECQHLLFYLCPSFHPLHLPGE